MSWLEHTPRFTAQWAADFAAEHYGTTQVTIAELPSERDQNFLLTSTSGDQFVLKVSNGLEELAFLDAQRQMLDRLSKDLSICPRIIAARSGAMQFQTRSQAGSQHFVRCMTYLRGVPMARVKRQSPELLQDLGRCLGLMDRALSDFDHPACHREFHWDLVHAARTIAAHRSAIADTKMQSAVGQLAEKSESELKPFAANLRRSVIHGDANDYNVLVDDGPDLASRHRRVTGIIDFGDLVHSFTVGNVAVAAAYAMLDKPDPLSAAANVVRGYHNVFPLSESELAACFPLICLRLCLSATLGAIQQQQRPGDDYLGISQGAVDRLLPRLLAVSPRFAEAVFRHACGNTPSPTSDAVMRWLRDNAGALKPVLGVDLRSAACFVFDLSVASPLLHGDYRENEEPKLTQRCFQAMKDAGVEVGVGRYNEPRLLYTSPLFAAGASPLDECRTIHLGMDLFAPTGTRIRAPLEGVVHVLANNEARLDYGPLVILRHEPAGTPAFFTLYGHLGLEVLANLRVGQRVEAGQQIATIGGPEVNGGWTPHLHLQIITDLLDLDRNFPGVALPSQRDIWLSFSPDPNLLLGISPDRFPEPEPTPLQTLAQRRQRIGPNLSLAYHKPVKIVRGWMQYLFDEEGRRYLDGYNNVPHVGHCHPRVVAAGQKQMAVLNTNTRYLHDLIHRYAQELTATLPPPLSVCYFLNSASEANELALRMARTHTRGREVIVLEHAYHGHTNALIDISPYKHAGPGGDGPPPWVHVAPIPDDYRGLYKRREPKCAEKYAKHVQDIIAQLNARANPPLAAFIAETCPSVAGQIILPEGYLSAVYNEVRAAGGVCIADEVQTGFGRIGTHFWAFQAHNVVPDIVVMGKPMGNGHPLAAVVTTPAIAASFANGMEFFSTFGGNPVSCAIGLAVLDVLREENLQEHAAQRGQKLLEGLRLLMERHQLIGDVRGSGLFLGVELVRDRKSLHPAGDEADWVVNRMREAGILVGTEGPHHNVIKIRPPMPFSNEDGQMLVATMDRVLAEVEG